MSYIAFALKYRPKTFDQIVGQQHIVSALKNAILQKHVHHAYLFSGPRGVGKTSLARIFAKSLNCIKGPTISPCGECVSCNEINRGGSLDVIEIDGASNRGIDEIRVLRENVKLSPSYSHHRIYIIDEVHMLTQEAFNALLKTLEEPPAHVKFIFATTHPQKILPTILSRCQKFQFTLVTVDQISEKLKSIVHAEKIEFPEDILCAIARSSGGSIRDAESLLDQIVPVIRNNKSAKDVLSFLGIVDEESLNTALKYIIEKDIGSLLAFIDTIIKEGKDIGTFLNAFIDHTHNLLLTRIDIKNFKALLDVSPQTKEFLIELSKQISTENILKIMDLLLEAKEFGQRLNTVRLPLELAIIKFAADDNTPKTKPEKNTQDEIQKVLLPKQSEKTPTLQPQPDDFEQELEKVYSSASDTSDKTVPIKTENSQNDNEKNIPNNDNSNLCDDFKQKWQQILTEMHKTRAAVASHLSFGYPISSQGNVITIGFTKENYFHKEILETSDKTLFIEKNISKFLNSPIRIKFIFSQDVESKSAITKAETQLSPQSTVNQTNTNPADSDDKAHEFIGDLLDTFGGKLHTDDE